MHQISASARAALDTIDPSAMLSAVERWCAVNTGTGNRDGLARQWDMLADGFAALPGSIRKVEAGPVEQIAADGTTVTIANGAHLVLSVRPQATRRVLLTGHMDTVFPADHPFQSARWLDDDTLNAPGAADMKGGLAVILHALSAFEQTGAAARLGYDVMINADEETGSLSSAGLIAELAQGKYAALTYEPAALPDGTLAGARGGSGNYSLTVTGKSAHAGRNPQDGRNAIVAAAALAVALKAMGHDELSVNPARIDGGAANNVVPDHAVLRFNIRPRTIPAGEAFARDLATLIAQVSGAHGVAISTHGGITRPPKPVSPAAARLFALVAECGAELGQAIGRRDTGGVCDGNNIAACGIPVVDTMGVRGGSIHSAQEYLIVPSLATRAALSALVLQRLASGASL